MSLLLLFNQPAQPASGGFTSPLAFWAGGAGGSPPPASGGFVSPLAFWAGGAGAGSSGPSFKPAWAVKTNIAVT